MVMTDVPPVATTGQTGVPNLSFFGGSLFFGCNDKLWFTLFCFENQFLNSEILATFFFIFTLIKTPDSAAASSPPDLSPECKYAHIISVLKDCILFIFSDFFLFIFALLFFFFFYFKFCKCFQWASSVGAFHTSSPNGTRCMKLLFSCVSVWTDFSLP